MPPADVFSLATANAVKPPPGPVQYRALRATVTDAEHGRLQLAVNVQSAEPYVVQIKPSVTVTGEPVDVMNARNVDIAALRAEQHALKTERAELDDAENAERVALIDTRCEKIDTLVRAMPKVSALICAPVARALMLMSAEDADAETDADAEDEDE